MNKLILFLISSSLFLGGCAASTFYRLQDSPSVGGVDAAKVQIFAGEKPAGKIKVIGLIAVDDLGNGDDAAKLLRKKAAEVGANAVINVRLTKITSYAGRSGLSGTAVYLE